MLNPYHNKCIRSDMYLQNYVNMTYNYRFIDARIFIIKVNELPSTHVCITLHSHRPATAH